MRKPLRKRQIVWNIKRQKILSLLLRSITEIYSVNKIKVKINNQLSEEHTINYRVRQGCPLSPTLFNVYINETIREWKQVYINALLYQSVQK